MALSRPIRWAILAYGFSIAAVAISGVTGLATIPAPAKAKEALRKYLSHGEKLTLNAVVTRKASYSSAEELRYSLSQDDHGRRKMVVLQPLAMQGMVSVDDGDVLASFCPDSSRWYTMPSPRLDSRDAEYRLNLTQRNYRLAVEKNLTIAGRPATVVLAVPVAKQMPTRRIAVDSERDVLLRVEVIHPGGKRETLYDTKAITFPRAVQGQAISITRPKEARAIAFEAPTPLSSSREAKRTCGFVPLIPQKIPYGFQVRSVEAAQNSGSRYVALRLTDGMVMATLYQWDRTETSNPIGGPSGMDRTIGNVQLRLAGELSEQVRMQIMESLANELGKTFRPGRELPPAGESLWPKRMPEFAVDVQNGTVTYEIQGSDSSSRNQP